MCVCVCVCVHIHMRFPRWHGGKESACQCRRCGFDPWGGKIPWRKETLPTPEFLPGEFHGQRGTWWATVHEVTKQLDMTEQLSIHTHIY